MFTGHCSMYRNGPCPQAQVSPAGYICPMIKPTKTACVLLPRTIMMLLVWACLSACSSNDDAYPWLAELDAFPRTFEALLASDDDTRQAWVARARERTERHFAWGSAVRPLAGIV